MKAFLLNIILKIAGIAVLLLAAKRDGKNEAVHEQMESLHEAARKEAQDWSNKPEPADIPNRLREAARKRKDRS